MGDLGVIALFAPPEVATLPLLMERLMGSYRSEAAAVVALVLVILTYALFWLFDREGGSMLTLEAVEIRAGRLAADRRPRASRPGPRPR